jgi:hypothetical protein
VGRLDDYHSRELRQRELAVRAEALEAAGVEEERQRAIEATLRDIAEFEQDVACFLEAMRRRGNPGTRPVRVGFFREVEAWWVYHHFWAHEWQQEQWDLFLTVDGEWLRENSGSKATQLGPVELPRDKILQELAKTLVEQKARFDDGDS